MGAFSLSHVLAVAVIAVLLFGRGKIADLMGEVGKGIRGFRKTMAEDDAPAPGVEREAAAAKLAAPARNA